MKKNLIIVLSVLLALTMLLGSCVGGSIETDEGYTSPDTSDEINGGTEPKDTDPDEATDPVSEPYVVKESYLPTVVASGIKTMFEEQSANFITYTYGSCPYVMRDMYVISDCKLLSISIPVSKTTDMDENGDFIFTVTVGSNQWYEIKNNARKVVSVKVNGDEYGLTANQKDVNEWIKVDLTEYDIVLSNTETVGFGNASDTLIPAYIGKDDGNAVYALIKENFPQMRGFVSKMGLGVDIGTNSGTLLYDFEWERTYESKEAYDAEVAAEAEYQRILSKVREEYSGKTISILGDSISTYEGYSNNTSYNSTIGGNTLYYQSSGAINNVGLYDHSDTYWYRLITDLEMDLCVNNSWSGSRVYDTARMPDRAGELDNDDGTTPDVIIFYMGINDLHNGTSGQMGDLYEILQSTTDKRSDTEKIAEWLDTFNEDSYTTFEQSYALCLDTMTEKYPNAEIWCMSLNYNKDSRFTNLKMKQYNRCISALAEYFDCNFIDQTQGYITENNCVRYSCDGKGLHPNPTGHALMEKYIVENFYKKLNEN